MRAVIGVVAHPDRDKWVRDLVIKVWPEVVSWDTDHRGAGRNHISTLVELREKHPSDWLVILEDDALPVSNFRDQVRQALCVAPTKIVSFYLGTGYPAQYQRRFTEVLAHPTDSKASWILHRQLRHGVAYAIHPDIATSAIHRMRLYVSQGFAPDDALSAFAKQCGEPVSYSNPSLVDHRDEGTVVDVRMHLGHPSAPGRKRPRKAHNLGTRLTWTDKHVVVFPL